MLLESIIEDVPVLVFIKDVEGAYLYVNKAYERVTELDRKEILGRTDTDLFPPELADTYRGNDLLAINGETPLQSEEPLRVEGEERTFAVIKSGITGTRKEPIGVFGLAVDITDSLRAEHARGVDRQRLASARFFGQLLDSLTPQEARVLSLLVEGLSDSEIAERLGLTSGTIRQHVSHVLKKLRKQSRTQAVVEMLKHRIP
ncbi:MAG: rsbT co-antagonist protein RsbR [Actinomycetota bacterium]|nr:rsbT co-antagonist protein RsbR [Actinomycetota bacterium]